MHWLEQHPAWKERLFWFVLTAGMFVFYGELLWGGIPSGADISLMFGPFFSVEWDGGPPLWAPYHLGGAGLYNNLQAEILYPPRWPFFFVDWRLYFGLFNFLHYGAALFGMAVFMRALRFDRAGALLGAFCFAMGGQMAARLMNPTILYAWCWMPWLLYGALAGRRRRRWVTTGAMAMILLLGSPHGILYGLKGFGIVLILAGRWKGLRGLAREAAWSAAHLALAAVLAAPTLVAGMQRVGRSLRTLAHTELNLADSMAFSQIPLSFLGASGGPNYPEHNDLTCYVGSVALLLALSAFCFARSWRDRRFYTGLALTVTGLLFALGENIGLQYIMPYVPGFRQLAGPMRGIILAALGMPLLAAVGMERLREGGQSRWVFSGGALLLALAGLVQSWRFFGTLPFPGASGGSAWLWWRTWLERPDCLPLSLFFYMALSVGLLLAAVSGCLSVRHRQAFGVAMAALVFLQLWHFSSRVRPPVLPREAFDPPDTVQYLQDRMQEEGPFRVAGYEPLRRGDADFSESQKFRRLMPNLAGLYGLEDIQGFDPLVPLDRVELFEAGPGRSPMDDPLRGLQMTHPDADFFASLAVRYLVGDPYMRSLTSVPQDLHQARTVAEVDLSAMPGPLRLSGWLAATSCLGVENVPPGMAIYYLEIETTGGETRRFPVRMGRETGNMFGPAGEVPLFQEWTVPAPIAPGRYGRKQIVYRTWIDFGGEVEVARVRWLLAVSGAFVRVWSQACRLAETGENWQKVWGDTGDVAIYRFLHAEPMAAWSENATGGQSVEWIERGANGSRLRVRSETPGRLLIRERWTPAWKAKVNGRAAEVMEDASGFCSVAVPAGTSIVRLSIWPRAFIALCCLSGLMLLGAAIRLGRWAWKERGK